jgi:hypothetical protein
MRPRDGDLARPLLCAGAAELRAYCAAAGIAYGEDASNETSAYARNVLRLEVLPRIEALNPRLAETLAASALQAAAEGDVLAGLTAEARRRVAAAAGPEDLGAVDVRALGAEPPALRALVLHDLVVEARGGHALVERRVEEALEALAVRAGAGTASLGGGLEAAREGDVLVVRAARGPHACAPVVLRGHELAGGPVAVSERLAPFLPAPRVLRNDDGSFRLERRGERPTSIGRVRSYQGSVGVLVRAYAYMLAHGGEGLEQVSEDAVLAANYLRGRLAETFQMPFPPPCMHEFVASAKAIRQSSGVRMLDVAKRLIDYGFHPPTIYFPLTVDEGMLVEPTETESLDTLDAFAAALIAIAEEARTQPDVVREAPHAAPLRRLDETTAARHPDLRWQPMTGRQMPCPD